MPRPGRSAAPAALAAALLLAAACAGDLPPESRATEAAAAPRASLDEAPAAAPACEPRSPGERLQVMRRGVEALPPAAALAARTRLLPQIAAVAQALGQGQAGRAAEGLRAFVGEIVELRLRAPFEERAALAAEAECLLHAVDPAPAEGV